MSLVHEAPSKGESLAVEGSAALTRARCDTPTGDGGASRNALRAAQQTWTNDDEMVSESDVTIF
ncbi:MAG TPA: hypothetical protein VLD17_05290 [Gemmatimonadaceae bacterium]|nr:hypothetical protein [Gemmatimonadaceae bacterium]